MKNPISAAVASVLLGVLIYFNFAFFPHNILSWDVFGYYLYLPFTFIYNDLGLQNDQVVFDIIEKYQSTSTFYQATHLPDGSYVMKYSMGLAILYAPFFFIGHWIAQLSSYPADGFSLPYQYTILLGGIVYLVLGIYFLRKVLLRFFSDRLTAIVLAIIMIGTNYFIHTSFHGQNAMSQNYLFTTYAVILWLSYLWHENQKWKYAILLAVFCGISALSRPSEIVCLLIPVFWGVYDRDSFIKKLKIIWKKKSQLIIFALIMLIIGSFQFIYWKIHTGKFIYYSYSGNAGEGFEFLDPYTWQVLFSFRKGWLIYTPVMIFAILGIGFIYRQKRELFLPILLFFIFNLYIVSSWSNWWYAQSFGQRSLVQSYTVMALPLGFFLSWLNSKNKALRVVLYSVIIACVGLNLFQTWQFLHGIIHPDRMTKDYYMAVFGKSKVPEGAAEKLLVDRSQTELTNENGFAIKMAANMDFEGQADHFSTDVVHSGNKSFKMDESTPYSPAFEMPYHQLTDKYYIWVRVSAWVYPTKDPAEFPFALITHFTHKGLAYKYRGIGADKFDLKVNQWNYISADYLSPEVRKKNDQLKSYIWNQSGNVIYVDEFKVEIFEPNVER